MANEIDLAWAAGFFDGEGSVTLATIRGKRGRPEGYKHLSIRISQVVREPLERFAAAVGAGNVTGPYKTPAQPQFNWQQGGNDAVRLVIDKLWPYLSDFKRAKIRAALDELEADLEANPRDHYTKLRERIAALSKTGMRPIDIASEVGLARRTVYYHLAQVAGGDA